MDTIEDYKILESQDLGSLVEKVNAALKEGWQPHGAPFIHVTGAAVVCCQAIVNFHQPTSAETIAKLRRAAMRFPPIKLEEGLIWGHFCGNPCAVEFRKRIVSYSLRRPAVGARRLVRDLMRLLIAA